VGAYSGPSDPLAVLKGPISKGRKGEGRESKIKAKWEGMEEEVEGGIWPTPKFVAWRPLYAFNRIQDGGLAEVYTLSYCFLVILL